MTILQYDPENWLVSTVRSLKEYVESQVDPALVSIEMSAPPTETWRKETPLDKTLIHFEIDDKENPLIGFGTPGVEVFIPSPDINTLPNTVEFAEAARHRVHFDVGVWASVESGGATARLVYHQLLDNIFVPAGAKLQLKDDTGGLWIVSFTGGRHATDRINDLPIWRAFDMTLIVEVFSRHLNDPLVVADVVDQDQELTISDDTGNQIAV
jgi:hypothetical protein